MMNKSNVTERHIHEECGVFGVYSKTTTDVASYAYYALYALQHRGQESAGIVVNDDGVFSSWRDVGLVSEVFPPERLAALGTGCSTGLFFVMISETIDHSEWQCGVRQQGLLASLLMLVVKLYMLANADFAEKITQTAQTLSSQSVLSCFLGAIFCGVLMTVATVSYRRENMVAETVITLFCVMVFILAGFKHCIANASMLLFLDCNYVNYLAMIAGNTVGSLCYGYLFQRARENG